MRVYDAQGKEKTGAEARYASIYETGGSTAQGSISTTPAKVTGFTANGPANDATPDHTNDQITIATSGTYRVSFQISFSGTVSTEFTFMLRNNAVEQPLGCVRTLGTGGDSGSCSFSGHLALSASDVLTVYVEADGASKSITPEEMILAVEEIAPQNSSGPASTDDDAIHDNVAGEIAAVTEKVSPVGADVLLIEDSAAGNVKKRVQITNLPAGSETNDLASDGINGIADDQLAVGTGAGTAAYQTLPNGAVSYSTAGGTFSQANFSDLNTVTHTHVDAANGGQLDHTTALTSVGSNTHAQIDTHISATATHGATGAVMGTTNTQTVTNKDLTDQTNKLHFSKSITVEDPADGDRIAVYMNERAVTITGVSHASEAGTSVLYNIEYAASIASGTVIHTDTCSTSTPEWDVTPSGTTSVPTDQIILLEITTVTGSVTQLHITIEGDHT